jgi:HlyD family secretion protein
VKKRNLLVVIPVLLAVLGAAYVLLPPHSEGITLTGLVTTDEVFVSPEIQGRLLQVRVREGDVVTNGQVLGEIRPQEWKADMDFYSSTERQSAALVNQARADLRFQELQTSNQVLQAEAALAAARDQVTQAEADLENARLTLQRDESLYRQGVEAVQIYDQSRTAFDAAKSHAESLRKQVDAAAAAVALAQSNAEQIDARRAVLEASEQQLAAAGAQTEKAKVHLGYTEIRAPINGIVDKRIALQGEVVNPAQAVVTLIDPDNLWIRADVEEGLIERIRLGDPLRVTLPSGEQRVGTVFYRSVDADYATQRDVSRTKRDIRTFEIRLRCDNRDRRLALGMTAYVDLPPRKP